MTFDNKGFAARVQETLGLLGKLRNALNFGGAKKGLEDISAAGSRFNMGGMAATIEGINGKFLAMSTIAITALANITNKAISSGTALAKSFTVQPIIDGLHEYETNLKSIGTIQANTDAPLKEVNAALDEMNHFSDQTIYNFSEMAKNVGTFTAAGVDLKTATSSIKGIANIAALSGASAEQAAGAMYQLSQAIASGKVGLMDWNSVVNAGMGGKKFQTALADTANAMGTLKDGAISLEGPMKTLNINGQSFRDSISAATGESWLTSDVLVSTLAAMDGRFSKTALAAQGLSDKQIEASISASRLAFEQKNGVKYTDAQFESLTKMSDAAFKAATQSKTFSDVMQVTKESVGSGWSESFRNIFGDLKEAKKLWTGVAMTLTSFTSASARARNDMLSGWKKMGGRDALIQGFKNGFVALMQVLRPIKEAFRDIFPAMTARRLFELTHQFREFTAGLKISGETAENIKRIFRGVFAAFSIVGQIIGGVIGVFADLFGVISEGSGGFLDFAGGIGDFIVSIDTAMKKGDGLKKFFGGISDILAVPIRLIQNFASVLRDMFNGIDPSRLDGVTNGVEKLGSKFEWLGDIGDKIKAKIKDFMSSIGPEIADALRNVGDAINTQGADGIFDALNTGLFAGVVLLLRNFFKNGLSLDFGGGFLESAREGLEGLTSTLGAMQMQLKSVALRNIAISIAILAGSLLLLSMINPQKLAVGMAAVTASLSALLGALAIMTTITTPAGLAKMQILSISLVAIATAVLILSAAVAVFSTMDPNELAVGLTALVITLGALAAMGAAMQFISGPLLRMAIVIIPLAIALGILAAVVKIYSTMSWEDLARGLVGLAGSLAIIAGALYLMEGALPGAAALLIIAPALAVLAGVMKSMGKMKWEAIAKGLVALGGSLLIIAGALYLMSGAQPGALALLIIAPALLALGKALKTMGKMKWSEIAKGLVALAGALLIIAGGLYLMTGALPGAAALLVVAAALAVLAPVLVQLGSMSWESIAKGLLALAGVFVVLGLAGIVLGPLIPVILGLGAALLLVGVGMALAGVGALALASAWTIFIAATASGVAVLGSLILLLPEFVKAVVAAVLGFVTALAANAAPLVAALQVLVTALLDAIIALAPKIATALTALIQMMLAVLRNNGPGMIATGLFLLNQLLKGIDNNISRITHTVARIIVKFLNALGDEMPKIIEAGVQLILKFIRGMTQAVDAHSKEMGQAGGDLAAAIIKGMVQGIAAGASSVANAIGDMVDGAIAWGKKKLGINSPSKVFAGFGKNINEGLAIGLGKHADISSNASEKMATEVVKGAKKILGELDTAVLTHVNRAPVIAPVLDLTQVEQGAKRMGSLMGSQHIKADLSYKNASVINAEDRLRRRAEADVEEPKAPTTFEFHQTNNSPKALSAIEIYRQTRNQFSLAKEALDVL